MTDALNIRDILSGGGLAAFVAVAVWTYKLGWWCTGRELVAEKERRLQAEASAAKWELMALRNTSLAEKAATIAETAQYAPAVTRPDGTTGGRPNVTT